MKKALVLIYRTAFEICNYFTSFVLTVSQVVGITLTSKRMRNQRFFWRSSIKSGFTLIEMVIVLLVIGILLMATMKFGSGRIVDLKAQSIKENFIGYYNEIYSQNLTSSFRDGRKYQQLTLNFATGMSYQVDSGSLVIEPRFDSFIFRQHMLDENIITSLQITLTPYILGCTLTSLGMTGEVFAFQTYVPENGKQYCFEIRAETCKLIEARCND